MTRFQRVPEPSILRHVSPRSSSQVHDVPQPVDPAPAGQNEGPRPHTLTGWIGAICMFPLGAIIRLCVALRIHPNTLTLIGAIVNVGAAWALGYGRFVLAGVIMI